MPFGCKAKAAPTSDGRAARSTSATRAATRLSTKLAASPPIPAPTTTAWSTVQTRRASLFPDCGPFKVHSGKERNSCQRNIRSIRRSFVKKAAKMVVEGSRAIAQVAREYGLSETTLGNWVRAYRETHASDEPPLELSERARLRELERQNRELEMENAFLKKAAAYFAREPR
jgi:transposase